MRKIVVAALVASGLVTAPAHAGPNVTVRVEGQSATLLERTRVTLPDTPSGICGNTPHTVADALDVATNGNWDRDDFIQTILGETHEFQDNNDFWALWNGVAGSYAFSQTGVCQRVMKEGDEALFLVDRQFPPTFESTNLPLGLRNVPAAVQAGTPVAVSVVTFAADGTASPMAGATVAGGGATATTGADGSAVLTFPAPGTFTVKASKAGSVPSAAEPVTVSATPVAPQPGPGSGGAPIVDEDGPVATFARLENGAVFSRRRAPRRLSGRVTFDPSGLKSVRLSILRKLGKRCWAFDGESERFERHRCGGRDSFRIGDDSEWSYLLPERLRKGRYTIRAVAIDEAGNDAATRVVIRVR